MRTFRPEEIQDMSCQLNDFPSRLKSGEDAGTIAMEFAEIIGYLLDIFPSDKTLNDIKTHPGDFADNFFPNMHSIRRLMPVFLDGVGLNTVDLTTIDTKMNVEKCLKTVKPLEEDDPRVVKMKDSLYKKDRVEVNFDQHPDQTNMESIDDLRRFKESILHEKPTMIYTGNSLETDNDVITSGLVRCCFIEIFIPNSTRHIAMHLPPDNNEMFGTSSYAVWTPGFFHKHLRKFMEANRCGFEDLKIKIVSGVIAPPNELEAGFLALGCNKENISSLQLPLYNFAVMTSAKDQSILARGGKAEYLPPSTEPPKGKIIQVTGKQQEFDVVAENIASFLIE